MAQKENVHLPADFFEREEIVIENIHEIVPEGGLLAQGVSLQTFSSICRTTNRRRARWKKLLFRGGHNVWSKVGLDFTNMIQSGLLKNVEDLILEDFLDLGDIEIKALVRLLQSGHLNLRSLKSHHVSEFRMVGAMALGSWLKSDHAQTLESLSINGGRSKWSYTALKKLLESFKSGQMISLVDLELIYGGFVDSFSYFSRNRTLEVEELIESLKRGQIYKLRRLKYCFNEVSGISVLASLAQCTLLGRLEHLELRGEMRGEDLKGLEDTRDNLYNDNDYSDHLPLGPNALVGEKAAFGKACQIQKLEVLKIYGPISDDAAFLLSYMCIHVLHNLRTLHLDQPACQNTPLSVWQHGYSQERHQTW